VGQVIGHALLGQVGVAAVDRFGYRAVNARDPLG
jgi:hypothetical protein